MRCRTLVGILVLGTACMVLTSSAQAGSVGGSGLVASVVVGSGGRDDITLDLAGLSTISDNGNGVFEYQGSYSSDDFDLNWDLLLDPDPVVAGAFGFANNTGAFKNFTITLTQPVSPALTSSLTGGSVGGSITDGNFSGGATVKTQAGLPLYTALIDGGLWQTLLNDPFSQSSGFGSAAFGAASFGTPIPSLPGPAISTDIGVKLQLAVSAGDVASVTFNFTAVPVPEPSTLVLGLSGLVGLVALVRRRS